MKHNDNSPPLPIIKKRSLVLNGHKTSLSLEDAFYEAAKEIAAAQGQTVSQFIGEIDLTRGAANLSSAVRVAVLGAYRSRRLSSRTS